MRTLYLLTVWLHVVAAAVWLGGFVFLAAVAVPVARDPDMASVRGPLIRRLGRRFRWIGWASLLVMVVTGLVLLGYHGVGPEELLAGSFWGTRFGRTLAVKAGLVGAVLILTAVHDFVVGPRAAALGESHPGAPQTVRARRLAVRLARLNLAVTLAVVGAGVLLARGG